MPIHTQWKATPLVSILAVKSNWPTTENLLPDFHPFLAGVTRFLLPVRAAGLILIFHTPPCSCAAGAGTARLFPRRYRDISPCQQSGPSLSPHFTLHSTIPSNTDPGKVKRLAFAAAVGPGCWRSLADSRVCWSDGTPGSAMRGLH